MNNTLRDKKSPKKVCLKVKMKKLYYCPSCSKSNLGVEISDSAFKLQRAKEGAKLI